MATEKNFKKNDLLREIIKANPKVPSLDFIQSYKDVLKTRDYFRHYNFHPKVFESLFDIGFHKFYSQERYDKKLLFDNIRIYYKKRPKNYSFSNEIFEKVIQLFKTAMLLDHAEAKMCTRSLIRDKKLPDSFIDWLIENWEVSEEIVTTLLRYPVKNDKIIDWAHKVFEEESIRSRRSELIGLKLDQDSSFKVSPKTIVADIEYYIQEEINGYKKFINTLILYHYELELEDCSRPLELEEISIRLIDEQNKNGMLPVLNTKINDPITIMEQIEDVSGFLKLYEIENLVELFHYNYKNYRLFKAKNTMHLKMHELLPKMLFYNKQQVSRRMIWGIYFSKLPKRTKEKLIMAYPEISLFYVVRHIAIKMKSIRLLKWLLVNTELETKARDLN